jgi:hypothetical protein
MPDSQHQQLWLYSLLARWHVSTNIHGPIFYLISTNTSAFPTYGPIWKVTFPWFMVEAREGCCAIRKEVGTPVASGTVASVAVASWCCGR